MKFFKPEEFPISHDPEQQRIWAAEWANTKLEREGKMVYGGQGKFNNWNEGKADYDKQKALLIAIEPIEQCKHPLKRCAVWTSGTWDNITLKCPCGVYLKAATFEVVE